MAAVWGEKRREKGQGRKGCWSEQGKKRMRVFGEEKRGHYQKKEEAKFVFKVRLPREQRRRKNNKKGSKNLSLVEGYPLESNLFCLFSFLISFFEVFISIKFSSKVEKVGNTLVWLIFVTLLFFLRNEILFKF